jgi:hypothetical protein
MSPSEVAACYRLYAVYCVDLAQGFLQPGRKLALLNMAEAWTRLADQIEKNNGTGLVFDALPLGKASS